MSDKKIVPWLREARVQELCRVRRPTWKSWARAGLIEEDPGGAYDERQVLGIALTACLREHLLARDVRTAVTALRRDGRWSAWLERIRDASDDDRFDLVVEPETGSLRLALDDASLAQAVRHPQDPRPVLVLPLAERLRRIRDGFRARAVTGERPRERRVGRPADLRVSTPTSLAGRE